MSGVVAECTERGVIEIQFNCSEMELVELWWSVSKAQNVHNWRKVLRSSCLEGQGTQWDE